MAKVLLFCFIILGCVRLFAQDTEQRLLIDGSIREYMQIVKDKSTLYYGIEQKGYLRSIHHPYFVSAEYVKARLSYRQIIYPEVSLRLDLNRNELVILSPEGQNIVLFPENVDYAELYGRNVIFFRADSMPGCPSSGYYFVLHSGKCTVMEKQSCTTKKKENMSGDIEYSFPLSINYYLYKDGIYHKIKNKKSLLNVLKPYKKELRRFISSNRLQFRRNAVELLTWTVNEYEKLSESLL